MRLGKLCVNVVAPTSQTHNGAVTQMPVEIVKMDRNGIPCKTPIHHSSTVKNHVLVCFTMGDTGTKLRVHAYVVTLFLEMIISDYIFLSGDKAQNSLLHEANVG